MTSLRINLAATFTCDLAVRSVGYWLNRLAVPHEVELAPYNRLFEQLSHPDGLPTTNDGGLDALLIRLEDWCRPAGTPRQEDLDTLRRNAEELVRLLSTRGGRSRLLVCICPPSPEVQAELGTHLAAVEEQLTRSLRDQEGIEVVGSRDLLERYPVADYYDPVGDTEGHLPYTAEFFTALGTFIARKAYALRVGPHKLLALDCDGTLWSGVCGEDGPAGVRLEPGHLALQRQVLAQREAGIPVVLCSKNVPEDVWAVLDGRREMLLRREHLAGWRIDWNPKSEGLAELAAELQVGLDRVMFLDDNPLECAEVARGCPDALVLQLPEQVEAIPGFLNHVWALDRAGITREDRLRAAHYQQNSARVEALQSAGSLSAFIARLELNVRIASALPGEWERVAQLSQRVTQFNTRPLTRTAAEIGVWSETAGRRCLAVHVADRFGDYGLVGAVLLREEADALVVESLLLSCRALGRGVEHRLLAHLGAYAGGRGLSEIRIPAVETDRNRPARNFLQATCRAGGLSGTFVIAAADAVEVVYRPETERVGVPAPVATPAVAAPTANRAATLAQLARIGGDVAALHAEVERSRLRSRSHLPLEYSPARTSREQSLAEIAALVLGFDQVGIHDNLFELGAHSLTLVQISSRVRDQLGVTLPFTYWFQDPTLAGVAARLEGESSGGAAAGDVTAALLAQLEGMSDEEAERLLQELEEAPAATGSVPSFVTSPVLPAVAVPNRVSEEGRAHRIETVALITRNRPDLVERCLTSVIENTARHGRRPQLLVFDDGRENDARLRERTAELAARHMAAITVYGVPERLELSRGLIRASEVPEDVVQFALFGDPVCDVTAGANRNHMLLRTVGRAVYCTDDDVIVRPVSPPVPRSGCGFAFGRDPGDYWFFPDAAGEERAAHYSSDDFLAAHERLLGRRVADVLSDAVAGYPGDAQRQRIALTLNGFVGDCAWGAPFGFWHAPMGYLLLEGASHARMVQSEAGYQTAYTSRRLLRVVSRETVSDDFFSMGGLMAYDNRRPLAPVFPSARGQDVIFGAVTWMCFPEAVFGHVPMALRHAPIHTRRFWPGEMTRTAVGMDLARFVIECLRATSFQRAEAQPGQGLRQLGERLRGLAALPAAEFQRTLLRQVRLSNDGWIARMEARLQEADGNAPYWEADVRRYIDLMAEAGRSSNYWLPLDLAQSGSPEARARDAQRLIGRFAELLVWWPTLLSAAADLGARAEEARSA